ncbi:hypothetical protein DF186_22975, partial [Enterococcus hirae]
VARVGRADLPEVPTASHEVGVRREPVVVRFEDVDVGLEVEVHDDATRLLEHAPGGDPGPPAERPEPEPGQSAAQLVALGA